MKKDAAHSSIYRTSDFLLVVIFGLGALVEYFLFWDWSLPLSIYSRIALGTLITIMGMVLIAQSKQALNQAKQPSAPGTPTTEIIQWGIYAKMRNPTYLGCGLLVLGLGVCFNFVAWMIGSLIAVLLMHFLLVLPEETYLKSKFPEAYAAYAKKVRRWL
ncbi:methyltransferase family protein [Spongiimicrobium sp. 2-473A-2-J]|uniref:methyltransferase family protein n=1 Tax=Eudoraea algarum TaxID=3417568 RepID=UPI003D36B83D